MVTRIPKWLRDLRDSRRWAPSIHAQPTPSRSMIAGMSSDLTRDVAFNRHSMNDGEHVSPSDNGIVQVGVDGIQVRLIQGIDEEAFRRTLSAATRATIGLDMTQTPPGDWEHCEDFKQWYIEHEPAFTGDSWVETCKHKHHKAKHDRVGNRTYLGQAPMDDWEEMLKGGLQTALESQTIVFAVSGTSRTCTHQLVRSRRAAFHQQSQRAGYMGDAPEVRMPDSVAQNPIAREAFMELVGQSWRTYRTICEQDISYQDARFALLEGSTNFILLEYPVKEFLAVYSYRACAMFQWEIVEVMRKCKEALVAAHPWIEPYVKISCERTGPITIPTIGVCTCGEVNKENRLGHRDGCRYHGSETVEHHCTFQGWEDVEGQCSFPWAKHEARTFKPEFHRISRKGGESS